MLNKSWKVLELRTAGSFAAGPGTSSRTLKSEFSAFSHDFWKGEYTWNKSTINPEFGSDVYLTV
jgi:hypothetical protein